MFKSVRSRPAFSKNSPFRHSAFYPRFLLHTKAPAIKLAGIVMNPMKSRVPTRHAQFPHISSETPIRLDRGWKIVDRSAHGDRLTIDEFRLLIFELTEQPLFLFQSKIHNPQSPIVNSTSPGRAIAEGACGWTAD
jgi:hypothetical protein